MTSDDDLTLEELDDRCKDGHHWDFPVQMGDWCGCGKTRWGQDQGVLFDD